jgi:hypothetical protein
MLVAGGRRRPKGDRRVESSTQDLQPFRRSWRRAAQRETLAIAFRQRQGPMVQVRTKYDGLWPMRWSRRGTGTRAAVGAAQNLDIETV